MLKNTLLKSSAIITTMTFISRIFGLIRDVVIARLFGAGLGSDVFFIAFKIPNLFRRLFAEGAFSQAFIPILSDAKNNNNEQDTQKIINSIGSYLLKALIITTVIAVIIAPIIILLFAYGFYQYPEKFNLATDMLRITFPYLLLISITAFFGAILNTYNNFAIPAFTPVLLNISIIICAVFLADKLDTPIMALAYGVLLGGIVQLLFQIPFLIKINKLPKLATTKHSSVKLLKKRMLPAIFGVSVSQINLLFDTIIASFLITGSISWLYYSDRLLELPLALIGIALATLSIAKLSDYFSKKDFKNFKKTIDDCLKIAITLAIPASIGLIVLAEPLIITLFQYQQFSANDSYQSSLSLMAYAIGLSPLIIVKILAPVFYARGNIRTPVKIAIVAMLTNIILNIIFAYYYQHTGIALATSISSILNAFLLYYVLHKKKIYKLDKSIYKLFIPVIMASLIMLIGIVYFSLDVNYYLQSSVWQRTFALLSTIIIAILSYFLLLKTIYMLASKLKLN